MEQMDDIIIETVIPANIQKLWQAWTNRELIMEWFGSDPGGKVCDAKLDPREGGHFEISFCDADGTEHTCSGIYKEVKAFHKLAFTWHWKSEPGIESFVMVTFSPENDHCRMKLEHMNTGNESKHAYLRGWQSTFDKLEKLVSHS